MPHPLPDIPTLLLHPLPDIPTLSIYMLVVVFKSYLAIVCVQDCSLLVIAHTQHSAPKCSSLIVLYIEHSYTCTCAPCTLELCMSKKKEIKKRMMNNKIEIFTFDSFKLKKS